MKRWVLIALLISCGAAGGCRQSPPLSVEDQLAQLEARYLNLALHYGVLFPDEIDFVIGNEFRLAKPSALSVPESLAGLTIQLQDLLAEVRAQPELYAAPEGEALIQAMQEMQRLMASVDLPGKLPLQDQIEDLYGLALDYQTPLDVQAVQATMTALLPGKGSLVHRLQEFQQVHAVPSGRQQAVLERALAECRSRTLVHWPQLAASQLEISWTESIPAAWHQYIGQGSSVVQANPRAMTTVSAILELACHEGYPGHHAQFVLQEQSAGGSLPVAKSVVLTRSLQSVKREAAAMQAVDLVFTPQERLAFEREVLTPLAGLDSGQAETVLTLHTLQQQLSSAILPILAGYLDGQLQYAEAARRLQSEALVTNAAGLLQYAKKHGSYLAGYTLLAERLKLTLSAALATEADPAVKWQLAGNYLLMD